MFCGKLIWPKELTGPQGVIGHQKIPDPPPVWVCHSWSKPILNNEKHIIPNIFQLYSASMSNMLHKKKNSYCNIKHNRYLKTWQWLNNYNLRIWKGPNTQNNACKLCINTHKNMHLGPQSPTRITKYFITDYYSYSIAIGNQH